MVMEETRGANDLRWRKRMMIKELCGYGRDNGDGVNDWRGGGVVMMEEIHSD